MELSILIFLPAIAAGAILLIPQRFEQQSRWVALAAAFAMFAISVQLFFRFDPNIEGYQFVQRYAWVQIGGFDLEYHVGVDGLSLPLVVLTTCLTLASVLISFSITHRPRAYYACLLILASSVVGVFVSLDLLLFFLFWELELFPMYLLISIWGSGRKEYSAVKFLLYTIAGSAFMLVGLLVLAFDAQTFNMEELANAEFRDTLLPLSWVFFLLFIGFAVKLPIVPFHTWLPDAHSDAPTAVSVMLAGVLLKMGGYGIMRLCVTMMPDVANDWDVWMAGLGAFSVLYGGFITLRQTDVKRLIAYSSVSHMGLVLLGIGALGSTGLIGATYQMVAHGLITGLMFVMIGLMYERTHTREIGRLGGLARQMPLIATGMVFAGMASLGLPALAGFIAEITIFLGAFEKFEWAVLASLFGVVLSAGYILWMLQRAFFGPVRHEWDGVGDQRHWWEHTVVAGLAALVVLLGVYPAILMDVIEPAMINLAARLAA
jgi:NADH-quinone oxidoreductase subunit M